MYLSEQSDFRFEDRFSFDSNALTESIRDNIKNRKLKFLNSFTDKSNRKYDVNGSRHKVFESLYYWTLLPDGFQETNSVLF